MKFNTINTLELSNICNLKCNYCVNKFIKDHPNRTSCIMSSDVFEASLKLIYYFCNKGTQREINVNGTGESTLDPDLIYRIKAVRNILGPHQQIVFSTNGVTMNIDLASQLAETGITRVDLSTHNMEAARRAAGILNASGLKGVITIGPAWPGHNWAGQLEPEYSLNNVQPLVCTPLSEGRGYVSAEGYVSPCCYDYRLLGAYGHVFDDDITEKEVKPYKLCHTCHQVIDVDIQKEYGFVQ